MSTEDIGGPMMAAEHVQWRTSQPGYTVLEMSPEYIAETIRREDELASSNAHIIAYNRRLFYSLYFSWLVSTVALFFYVPFLLWLLISPVNALIISVIAFKAMKPIEWWDSLE